MNKKIIMVLGLVLLLAPVIGLAKNESGTSTKREVRIETRKENTQVKVDKRIETRQERVRAEAEKIFSRLNHLIDQLASILTRVDSRIAKLEASGKDVTAAKTASAEAKTLLDQARNSIPALQAQVDSAASSTKPLQTFQPIKANIKNTMALIRQAREKIMDAIKTLLPKNNQ